ncbi:MAG: DUF4190 domain-containing protein [Planctomycetaceae bacterium]|nr:DUF4190 domain-containing protein [Planctomycetaceae bacterium]
MSMESKHSQPRKPANNRPHSTTSGKAITSLVLGLLSLFGACLTGIPGLIFGIVGLGEINRSRGRVSGRGVAVCGIVFSSLGIAWSAMLLLLLPALLLPAIQAARDEARQQLNQAIEESNSELINSGRDTESLSNARKKFPTRVVNIDYLPEPIEKPDNSKFELIHYKSGANSLAAYVTPSPQDGAKHPAIIWIPGGHHNSIEDVWTPRERSNDQTASAFRKAGIVMMFASTRGGNDNPGSREGFFGEVDDILAAADHLANLPYVDPAQIYLGGHSTGGTLAMLVGESSDKFRAIFALGPVAYAHSYRGDFVYCDPRNTKEMELRSPIYWLSCVSSPMYVFEGEKNGNWDELKKMSDVNLNPNIQFHKVRDHDHFSLISPLTEALAEQIKKERINVDDITSVSLD